VICGPGSINQAHTLDEYVEIDQLTAAAKIYLRTVLKLLA
jgi:acetylornithine deacetylase